MDIATAPPQGEPVSSWLHVRVVRIVGLRSSDKAVPSGMLKQEDAHTLDEADGVAIEINSPMNGVRPSSHPCHAVHPTLSRPIALLTPLRY